tara:strand:- start:1821 stop:1976 length:156 start_codon:yes stop_codon:yes gene_type:complete
MLPTPAIFGRTIDVAVIASVLVPSRSEKRCVKLLKHMAITFLPFGAIYACC